MTKNDRPGTTPVAVIKEGTGPRQETLVTTLDGAAEAVEKAGFAPPAVIVVGEVVSMRDRIRWFDNRPLFGKRVLVTRSRQQASVLSQLLSRHGAMPVELPTIQIEPMADSQELDRAIDRMSDYSWLIFTSANGVDVFFKRLRELGRDSRSVNGVRLCAIGPATAAALERNGLIADQMPQEFLATAVADTLGDEEIGRAHV